MLYYRGVDFGNSSEDFSVLKRTILLTGLLLPGRVKNYPGLLLTFSELMGLLIINSELSCLNVLTAVGKLLARTPLDPMYVGPK